MKKTSPSSKTHLKAEVVKIEDAVIETTPKEVKEPSFTPSKTQIKPTYIAIGVLVVALLSLAYYFKSSFIAAIVNGQPIWRSTLNQKLSKQYGQQTLDMMVTEKLIEQQALKNNVQVSADDVNKEISQIEEQLKPQGQTLDQVLLLQGMTRADLEQQMKLNLWVQKLSSADASPSATEIATYIKDNPDSLPKDVTGDKLDSYVSGLLADQKKNQTIQTWLVNLKQGAKIEIF